MAADQMLLVMPVVAGDVMATVTKHWPFTMRPIAGELVSVRIMGWDGPQRVPIHRVWWEPIEPPALVGVTYILLPHQVALAEKPTLEQVLFFYRGLGWVPYTGRPL